MTMNRKTIATSVAIEGIGLHTGIYTRVELRPAPAGAGITFVRVDLNDLRIPALQSSTTALDYATTVGKDDIAVGTVEHLLSSIVAFGITDIDIVIDGTEVPIIDGSALPFVHLIEAAGTRELEEKIDIIRVRETIEVRDGDKFVRIEPARNGHLSIRYSIDFPHPIIGRQSMKFELTRENFERKLAGARTFGFLRDVEKMRAAGLARGGSVENCIVLDDTRVINGALRYHDEFVRHKVLDLVGDLALLGRPVIGEITASRAGHALHSRFVAAVLAKAEEWRRMDAAEQDEPAESASTGYWASASRQG
jgi:UDP-3-O-[3-hydroxymyristoyl] N-acetylglucosamine deacetylase